MRLEEMKIGWKIATLSFGSLSISAFMMMTIQCIGSSPLIVSNYYNITTKHAKRKEKYESKRAFYCCKHVVAIERLAAR